MFLVSDMQKFPLRLKDNDLLITELYHDSSEDAITALSVYLTPKNHSKLSNYKYKKLGHGFLNSTSFFLYCNNYSPYLPLPGIIHQSSL